MESLWIVEPSNEIENYETQGTLFKNGGKTLTKYLVASSQNQRWETFLKISERASQMNSFRGYNILYANDTPRDSYTSWNIIFGGNPVD